MAFAPKEDGGPNLKFYESQETLQLLEGVKTWLLKNCKKVSSRRRKSSYFRLMLIPSDRHVFFGNSMFKRSHQQRKVSQQRSFKLSSFKKMLLAKISLNHLSPESQQSAFWILDLTVAFVKYWPQSTSKHSVQYFHENKSLTITM